MSETKQIPNQQQSAELPEDISQLLLEAQKNMELLSKAFPVDMEEEAKFKIMFGESLIAVYGKKTDPKK